MFEPITAFVDPNESVFTPDEEINSVPVPQSHWIDEKLSGLFTIDGLAYDVTLTNETLNWKKVDGQGKGSKFRKKKGWDGDEVELPLTQVYGVALKRIKNNKQSEGDGICHGIIVYTYQRKGNTFKNCPIFLQHPSEGLCTQWSSRIAEVIKGFSGRPRDVLLFIQPFAGKKDARCSYRVIVEPVLKCGFMNVEYVEIEHNEHIKQFFVHAKLENYDCIAVMGGDGTVSKVVHHLLNKVQMAEHREPGLNFTPARCELPVAIIPVGTVNSIARSVQGVEDVFTATLHMALGNKKAVDISAAFVDEKLHKWVFHSQYGFYANVLKCMSKYNSLGLKKVSVAHIKALTKSKFIPYEMDIKYIPASSGPDHDSSHPRDGVVCKKGCKICKDEEPESDSDSVYQDEVIELDPLAQSNQSDTLIELANSRQSAWKSLKGQFLSVGLFSLPCRSETAPQGFSKYAHLGDGCMDLVLVNKYPRKEFIRFLKRQGSSKNQLDLPFVECFRVKEAILHQRQATTWKHKDHSFSEINYEMKKAEKKKRKDSKQASLVEVIADLDLDDSDDADDIRDDEDDDDDDDSDGSSGFPCLQDDDLTSGGSKNVSASNSANGSLRGSAKDIDKSQSKKSRKGSAETGARMINRLSFLEKETLKRKQKKEKKEKKLKEKDEALTKTMWNLDNEIDSETDLHFVVYQKLVTLSGLGIFPDSEPGESKLSWLPAM